MASLPGSTCSADHCWQGLGRAGAEFVAAATERCRAELYRDGGWWLDYTRIRVIASKP